MIGRILIGIAICALGGLMIYKTPWFLEMLGRLYSAEKFFGGGGTRLFYKLFGITLIVLGFIVITNLWEDLAYWLIAPLFGIER